MKPAPFEDCPIESWPSNNAIYNECTTLYHERRKLHKDKLLARKLAQLGVRSTPRPGYGNPNKIMAERGIRCYFTEDGALSLIVIPLEDVMGVPENRSAIPLKVTRKGPVRSSGPALTDFTS